MEQLGGDGEHNFQPKNQYTSIDKGFSSFPRTSSLHIQFSMSVEPPRYQQLG